MQQTKTKKPLEKKYTINDVKLEGLYCLEEEYNHTFDLFWDMFCNTARACYQMWEQAQICGKCPKTEPPFARLLPKIELMKEKLEEELIKYCKQNNIKLPKKLKDKEVVDTNQYATLQPLKQVNKLEGSK